MQRWWRGVPLVSDSRQVRIPGPKTALLRDRLWRMAAAISLISSLPSSLEPVMMRPARPRFLIAKRPPNNSSCACSFSRRVTVSSTPVNEFSWLPEPFPFSPGALPFPPERAFFPAASPGPLSPTTGGRSPLEAPPAPPEWGWDWKSWVWIEPREPMMAT